MTQEEMLLLAALKEKGSGLGSQEVATGAGALGGALAGLAAGQILHPVGRAVGHLKGSNHMLKPGFRLAGTLIGAGIGGQLGPMFRQQMLSNSEEARILAAEQAGTATDEDRLRMQLLIADQLGKMGIA